MSAHASPTLSRVSGIRARGRTSRRGMARVDQRYRPSLVEAAGAWALLLAVTAAVFVTYSRVAVADLYNVSDSGIAGGAGQALIVLNFPGAFIAIALIGFAVARLYAFPDVLTRAGRWTVGLTAALGVLLALIAALPGVVEQSDLTAKPVNALPATGVLLALILTIVAVRLTGFGTPRQRGRGDVVALAAGALLVVLGLPWFLADLGVYVEDIPLIGGAFMSKEIVAGETLPAVHLGHHHGLSGVMFALVALALMRPLMQMGRSRLRWPLTIYVAFMLVYGVTNAVQDFWGEQLVKRGTTTTEFPSMLRPDITPAWGLVLLATFAISGILWRAIRSQRAGNRDAAPIGHA